MANDKWLMVNNQKDRKTRSIFLSRFFIFDLTNLLIYCTIFLAGRESFYSP